MQGEVKKVGINVLIKIERNSTCVESCQPIYWFMCYFSFQKKTQSNKSPERLTASTNVFVTRFLYDFPHWRAQGDERSPLFFSPGWWSSFTVLLTCSPNALCWLKSFLTVSYKGRKQCHQIPCRRNPYTNLQIVCWHLDGFKVIPQFLYPLVSLSSFIVSSQVPSKMLMCGSWLHFPIGDEHFGGW